MVQNRINAASNIIQYVTTSTGALITCSGTIPYDDSIPQIGEGTEIITLAITPKYSVSTLEIVYTGNIHPTSGGSTPMTLALFQDATSNALCAISDNLVTSTLGPSATLIHTMTSGTTSSTTFRIRGGSTVDPLYGNSVTASTNRSFGGVSATSFTIIEYI